MGKGEQGKKRVANKVSSGETNQPLMIESARGGGEGGRQGKYIINLP